MKRFLKDNVVFLSGALLVLLVMFVALVTVPKAELHLWLNSVHTPWMDRFFKVYTQFVQWPVYILMLLPLVCWKQGWTAVFAVAELASVVVIQSVKALCNMPRPKTFFGELVEQGSPLGEAWQQVVVEGVRMHSWHSFPSGHTATFFIFFSVCALAYAYEKLPKSQLVGLCCLLLGLLGGYSRIYLSQHFLLDVCVGMAEGVLMASVVVWLFEAKGWTEQAWFRGRLFRTE